jgi:hypothetical protein
MLMTMQSKWLIDEQRPLTGRNLKQLDRELAAMDSATRAGGWTPRLAVSLHDVVVLDNRKWFGGADVRVDALVVTGYGNSEATDSFYMPKTAAFPRIGDGQRLPIGEGGLLVFHGTALHFLDIFIMVSRDRKDSDSLAGLLTKALRSEAAAGIAGSLIGLSGGVPEANTVKTALQGAAALGDLAYNALQVATGDTIGLYRNSHLQYRDGFGIGPHPGPRDETYNVNDLTFRYAIDEEG